jgi:carbon starvation protein
MLMMLFLIAAVVFLMAFKIYGAYQRKVYELDDNRETPSKCMFDGMDYCPAHPAVLLGHHFSSIAGAGPIVGPIAAAAMFGWLPAYIWVLVGSVFFGGVHDMGAVVASIRHRGLSIGEVVAQWIGKKGKRLFLCFTWLALTLVIAVFLELAAQTFAADPAVAFSGILYIFLAMVFGVAIYRYGISLKVATLIMVPIILGAVFFGSYNPWVQSTFKLGIDTWRWILVVYIFGASVLPVWLLLQPRDYLASYLLYFSLFIGGVGMLFGSRFEIKLPAFKGFTNAGGEFLWPLLFVTVACGAISGFHALVGSGTTSKQLRKETDAVAIGYGSMLVEGIVAVIAIGTIMIAGGMLKGGPTVVYGAGLGKFSALLGIDPKVGTSLGLLALNSFILTSLDTATRLARYQLQEFFDMKLDRYSATAIGVAVAIGLIFWKTGNKPAWALIWPVFGASNQLVAALSLMTIGVWVMRGLKKSATFVMVPMAFMLVTTVAALFLLIKANLTNPIICGISVLLLILAALLVKETWSVLGKKDDIPTTPA